MKLKMLGLVAGLALSGAALAQGQQQVPSQPPRGQEEMQQHEQMHGQMHGQMMGQQKELTGRVVGTRERRVYVQQENGAIVALEVSRDTLINGQPIRGERIESQLRRQFQPGVEVRANFDVQRLDNIAVSLESQQMQQQMPQQQMPQQQMPPQQQMQE